MGLGRSIMKKLTKIATLALSVAVAALPAHASDGTSAAATAGATSAKGDAAKVGAGKKICINLVPDTGSRLVDRQCKTKAQWADEGVELAPKK
jgi:hypothetical protein